MHHHSTDSSTQEDDQPNNKNNNTLDLDIMAKQQLSLQSADSSTSLIDSAVSEISIISDSKETKASSSTLISSPPTTKRREYGMSTQCVVVSDTGVFDPYRASAMPIYQTATFKQISATEMGDFDYTRSGNPTRSNLESHLAKVMKATRALATSTGMSALDVITRLVSHGEEIVAGDDLYGGTNRLLGQLERVGNIKVHHVDTTDLEAVRGVLNTRTKLVLLETPTNPCIKIADIPSIASLVHETCPNALVVVDNTMMSPVLMNPLLLGADIEYHSGTKFLSGHHDLMAGVIAVKDDEVGKKLYFIINATGTGLSPFDSFLLLRGVKTLTLRVLKQQENAIAIARHLQDRRGYKVRYPGLESHNQYELHKRMSKGAGSVLAFTTGCEKMSKAVVEGTRVFGISVSFGCVNSLISMPCNMSHASIPAHIRSERGLPEDLIRLCVGIEDIEDLIEDLDAALDNAERLFGKAP